MNRRQAIQQIAVAGAAITLFPGCRLEEIPVYAKIPLERKSWKVLKHLAEAVLPVDYEAYPAPEPRAIYMLNVLNDCTSKEKLDAFLAGFERFQIQLEEQKTKRLDKMSNEDLDAFVQQLEGEQDEEIGAFYTQLKSLAQHHFTTSERFMKEELDFRFIPTKYQGDVDITTKVP